MLLTCQEGDLLSERQLLQDLFDVNISHFYHFPRACFRVKARIMRN
jgi:mannose/cellobiose epimerase-like protein (N-acyl-D-glucosamine 2-epimerase family)